MSQTSTDPIADMLTRIRNAINVGKSDIVLPHSKMKLSVAELLKNSGFIDDVKVIDSVVGKNLKVTINDEDSNARITEITRMSKPGRRYYAAVKNIPRVKNGRGMIIVSTSSGLMTDDQARAKGLGGELICKVY